MTATQRERRRSWRETDYVMPRGQAWLWRITILLVTGLVCAALAELPVSSSRVPSVPPWRAAYQAGYKAGWRYFPSYTPALYSTPRAHLYEYWCFRARKYGISVANMGGSRAVGITPRSGSMVPAFSKSLKLNRAWIAGCKVSARRINRERNGL